MKSVEFKTISGSGQIYTYTRQEFETTGKIKYNKVVADLFRYLKELDCSIYWIRNVKLNPGASLHNFVSEYHLAQADDQWLLFAQAGTVLDEFHPEGLIEVAQQDIKKQRDELHNAGFVNIIFNRKMKHSFMNTEVFIYLNDMGDDFIADNIGDVQSDKIINRTATVAKLEPKHE